MREGPFARRKDMRLPLLLALVTLPLAGCRAEAPSPQGATSGSVTVNAAAPPSAVAPASPSAPATTSATPQSASAAPLRRPLAEVRRATEHACQPAHPADNNMEQKQQQLAAAQCVERAMNRELDRVLLPLKASSPARFRTLMDQQASYRRFGEALAFLAEEAMWVDFTDGTRSDGTMRSIALVSCMDATALARTVYAEALAAADAGAMASEIREVAKRGAKTKKALAEIEAGATKHTLHAPKPPEPGATAMTTADWKTLFDRAQSTGELAATLARSTCADFPGLAAALGGERACHEAVALYHLGTCELEPNPGDGR